MAQMRLLDDNLDVLVLVLLNEIPEKNHFVTKADFVQKRLPQVAKVSIRTKIVLAKTQRGTQETCSCRPLLSAVVSISTSGRRTRDRQSFFGKIKWDLCL